MGAAAILRAGSFFVCAVKRPDDPVVCSLVYGTALWKFTRFTYGYTVTPDPKVK